MARYYDLDTLAEMCRSKADTLIEGKEAFLYVAKWLDLLPPADVVPKSKVEELKKDRYQILPDGRIELLPRTDIDAVKAEVAREIFEEIETVLCRSVYPKVNANGTITSTRSMDWHIRCDDYNAIKKKYVEDQGDGGI